MNLDVVFVDNHILVVNKPAGMSTQDHEGAGESLEHLAKAWIKKTYNKPGAAFLQPIHRLDKPVSGLVLFARTSKALSRLQEQMRERKIVKTYFADVEGHLPEKQGRLEHYLVHDEFRARISSKNDPAAKLALLDYKVLEEKNGISRLEIILLTGRYHQIRAQLSALHCPIVGDEKYGSAKKLAGGKIALHHGKLAFEHPVTHEQMCFEKHVSG